MTYPVVKNTNTEKHGHRIITPRRRPKGGLAGEEMTRDGDEKHVNKVVKKVKWKDKKENIHLKRK